MNNTCHLEDRPSHFCNIDITKSLDIQSTEKIILIKYLYQTNLILYNLEKQFTYIQVQREVIKSCMSFLKVNIRDNQISLSVLPFKKDRMCGRQCFFLQGKHTQPQMKVKSPDKLKQIICFDCYKVQRITLKYNILLVVFSSRLDVCPRSI